jgi:hypothetical protein
MTNNDSIVFAGFHDDDDDIAWCDSCDAWLFERRDGSTIFSNGSCGLTYSPDSITKHKTGLHPRNDPYARDDPEGVPLRNYYSGSSSAAKREPKLDKEDKAFIAQGKGRSISEWDGWFPE